jgi:hypothetical protein
VALDERATRLHQVVNNDDVAPTRLPLLQARCTTATAHRRKQHAERVRSSSSTAASPGAMQHVHVARTEAAAQLTR